ncbi:predicted protein [Sclerotinia sclerotiorum 1980 UF-70]|uniref:Uncharacterized protein n=1 Tax=Sclerotinia sclerotiorum (strain ATCC 18683 / 1980 / Ss-1) TaxID=665079 RepID=A7E858_SCLS1|nr:predicted protein [Sclerotinia sclerotiorum 1980 UF-70]EDN96560.1 predicted protein [Sclerotinia sclerotiorum 1980 UF-70]
MFMIHLLYVSTERYCVYSRNCARPFRYFSRLAHHCLGLYRLPISKSRALLINCNTSASALPGFSLQRSIYSFRLIHNYRYFLKQRFAFKVDLRILIKTLYMPRLT